METFAVKFRENNFNLDAIVTAFNQYHLFKVEMVANEPSPIKKSKK
jgi:hypothetical protein